MSREFRMDRARLGLFATALLFAGGLLVAGRAPAADVAPDAAKDVAADMAWYSAHREELPRLREAARQYALRSLDWRKNAAGLPGMIAMARVISGNDRIIAREKTRNYERNEGPISLKIYSRSRLLYHVARVVRGLVAPRGR